jgi:hypothetical protein
VRCKKLDAQLKDIAYYFFFCPITKTNSKEVPSYRFFFGPITEARIAHGRYVPGIAQDKPNHFLSADSLTPIEGKQSGAGETEIFQANQRQRSDLVSDVDQSRTPAAFRR